MNWPPREDCDPGTTLVRAQLEQCADGTWSALFLWKTGLRRRGKQLATKAHRLPTTPRDEELLQAMWRPSPRGWELLVIHKDRRTKRYEDVL